ncbi:MAG: Ig-like domain-containing protein, partial [Vulcanimicrobiota bacterium]
MNPATLTNSSFTLTGPNGAPVAGTVTTFGRSAVFDPATNLVPGDTYVAEITTGAQGNTNNALAAPFVWTFTVEPLDNTAPTVTLTDPTPGEDGVAL